MPPVSLIPDRQLTFSPELAETIGLEEAVLLQALGEELTDREAWTAISLARLQATLSFWSVDQIADLIAKLVHIRRQGHLNEAESKMLLTLHGVK